MAGLPIVDLDAEPFQLRIAGEQPGRFDVDDEGRVRMQFGEVARQHDADLVGEDLVSLVVDHAAAVAVAVEAEREVGAILLRRRRHRMQHVQVFGIGIVARKGEVELAVERHDLGAERRQQARRERAGGAVAAGRDDFHLALPFRPGGQLGDVAGGKVLDEFIGAAAARAERAGEHDVAQPSHLVRPESHRPRGAHLDAGPAVVVVRGGDHRDGGNVERELGEIGHRRDRQADVARPWRRPPSVRRSARS